ncbi:phosphatase 2C-like domain-containing protein [Mrakia frigida]|uniref:phosphatase 2C-like domain-containing protein n=1 Tax=Mrakia frigida TaxID=29902 RepID=UPI003FCC22DF
MFRAPFQPTKAGLPLLFRFLTSTPASPPPISPVSLPPPKFAFQLGLAFAGKPRRRGEQIPQGLAGPGEKVAWRDEMLAWSPEGSKKPSAGGVKLDAGEDFFFIREEKEGLTTLAVADGVGGWADSGVDPSVFSQALMYYSYKASAPPSSDSTQPRLRPSQIMQKGYDAVLEENEVKAGSATACVIQMSPHTGLLQSANLGDSGYAVIRKNTTFLEIPGSQQHYFNCPRQLAKVPKRRGYSSNISDTPSDADLFSVQLEEGDMIVCFTDGMSDNIHNPELLLLLEQALKTPSDGLLTPPSSTESLLLPEDGVAQRFADTLLRYGKICMNNQDKVSPFQVAAAKEGLDYRGGKVDDFTVITALVVKA